MLRPCLLVVAAATAACALVGCGGPKTTSVTGTVKILGRQVMYGNVTILGSDNISRSEPLQPDGTFRFEEVAVGPCKIGVNSPPPENASTEDLKAGKGKPTTGLEGSGRVSKGNRPQPPPGTWFEVNDSLGDPLKSGLTGEIKAGVPLDIVFP